MGDLWELCAGSSLFVFNGVDLVCGVVLTVYSLYLGRPLSPVRLLVAPLGLRTDRFH